LTNCSLVTGRIGAVDRPNGPTRDSPRTTPATPAAIGANGPTERGIRNYRVNIGP